MADARPGPAATATVSSLKSEDSTEQLICKTPQNVKKLKTKSVSSKSVEAGSEDVGGRRRLVVVLGLAQVVVGALLVCAGAVGVVRRAPLARVGAGLWAGGLGVVTGVVGLLAGINDCYGLNDQAEGSSPLLTAFLALSLISLACGNSAAVLAASGLQRASARPAPDPPATFDDEMEAWNPVMANIAVLVVASVQCLLGVASVCHVSRRVCACLRARRPFDHNQFEPGKPPPHLLQPQEKIKPQHLCKDLEGKLQETLKKKKDDNPEFGSANSKEKLVSHWLGRQQVPPGAQLVSHAVGGHPGGVGHAGPPAGHVPHAGPPPGHGRPRRGVRKPQPVMLVPASSTLGRLPMGVVLPPRYATLPLPPAHYPPPSHLYYPLHDARLRRRRSPRERRAERRRRDRDSKLTRSLERIHRRRRADNARPTDADLKRTYTGLDRAYAEQFIAVCDESRHQTENHDSLGSTSTSSDTAHSQTTA